MGIVLTKGKLVKLFMTSTLSQVIRKKSSLVDYQAQKPAVYFGYKIHYDQNKKLAMQGAVHVCARDGYSGTIVQFAAITIKHC